MKVEICAAESAKMLLGHPSTKLLKKALTHARLSGVYTLSSLRNGHASAPRKVVGLTLGAACREGVIVFYPNGTEPPKGYALLVEKKGDAPIINTNELHRKLCAALKEIEPEEQEEHHDAAAPSQVVQFVAPTTLKQGGVPPASSPRYGPKRENAVARVLPLFEVKEKVDALHGALFARATTNHRRDTRELEKRDVNSIIREHFKIHATQDLAVAFGYLVKFEIIFPMWKGEKVRSSSKEPCVIAPPKSLVAAPTMLSLTPDATHIEPAKEAEVRPAPDLRTQIAELMQRQRELLPAYEEYLKNQLTLLDIKRMVAELGVG